MKRAFLDKLLARLRRIQPEDVEAFFVELARDKRFLETIFNAIREGVIVTDTANPALTGTGNIDFRIATARTYDYNVRMF